jgi:TPR repeat protein
VQSSALSRVNSTSLALRGAQDFADARRAEIFFREGNEHCGNYKYEEAIATFMQGLALNPLHIEMRAALGHIYTYSCSELRDYKEGFKHFSIAAELGDADAQSALASMYRDGEGITRNDQLAFFWQKKAAMHGHPCDQRHLGLMYEHGVGVERDPDMALLWYQKAADQGGYFERSQIQNCRNASLVNKLPLQAAC